MFWQMEIAGQLESMKRTLQEVLRRMTAAEVIPSHPNRTPELRKYYAIEYVSSVPVKLDWVGREKPKTPWQHEIMAKNPEDARKKLIERLTAERTATPPQEIAS
jgi:hypothetical protein